MLPIFLTFLTFSGTNFAELCALFSSSSLIYIFVNTFSCPPGSQITANRLDCEDRNECDWHPCGRGGKCYNIPNGGGYYCDCLVDNFRCDNCTCDEGPRLQRQAAIGIGNDAILIIVLCIVFYMRTDLGFTLIGTRREWEKGHTRFGLVSSQRTETNCVWLVNVY